jgi:PfaB family protein
MNKPLDIAVVGMAGLFPGAANLDRFWENIVSRVDASADVPRSRWIADPDSVVHGIRLADKALTRRCCLIDDFKFDPDGFAIDAGILDALDPLYHIILHTAAEALSHPEKLQLPNERTGVCLAAIALPTDSSSAITRELFGSLFAEKLYGKTDYQLPSREQLLAARVTSLPAAILAEAFGLGGGTLTLDAACASSIYAVKLACDELRSHRADAMLAGGVSRPECLYTQIGFSQLQALSPSGRCAPFDRSADGLVVGEGAGILILKRLTDALEAGDRIHGIIRGVGLSNDMRGNLLAPASEGQVRAMTAAYQQAGWSPRDVDLIECHGAGTPVGDATELASLRTLWENQTDHKGRCPIGSIKSMIGHLLTAAGAAGMIKTLLALNHKMLPPSINFEMPPENSPLIDSPFRVQVRPEEWVVRDRRTPRRAAVSAFGFGGINGHLLFEEWNPDNPPPPVSRQTSPIQVAVSKTVSHSKISEPRPSASTAAEPLSIAIIGMEATFGGIGSLRDFQETLFNGRSAITDRPAKRWHGCEQVFSTSPESIPSRGAYMDALAVDIGDFHIPPKEIPDILPQHLLMLKVAAAAMSDADLPHRENRPRMGVIVGLDFDYEATNFHFRWSLPLKVREWLQRYHPDLPPADAQAWLEVLQDNAGPGLTPSRTLGALAGIVASRIAREFKFGGPSFVVSAEESSGLKAMEIGARALQQGEMDAVLIGAVDFNGDLRRLLAAGAIDQFSASGNIRPFDREADGTLPGEGAAAIVLKPYEQAVADGDRIYGVIKGIGSASGGGINSGGASGRCYVKALERALSEAGGSASDIGLVETHGSGIPDRDRMEARQLHAVFNGSGNRPAIGAVKANIGHTGAAAGMAAVVKGALSIFHEIIPPLANFSQPGDDIWHRDFFHVPILPQYWFRDRQKGPRRVCVNTLTSDGGATCAVLESAQDGAPPDHQPETAAARKTRPLGWMPLGLFAVSGDERKTILDGLEDLSRNAGQKAPIDLIAADWHRRHPCDPTAKLAVAMVCSSAEDLRIRIADARNAVETDSPMVLNGRLGIAYNPSPACVDAETAFVYPGSGNHYIGLGREILIRWPDIVREMDAETPRLKSQTLPDRFMPQRVDWTPDWTADAYQRLTRDPLNMIFGQVVHGDIMTRLVTRFGIKPGAVIGYSLGESAGLFANGIWPDRDEMLKRMLQTDLFTSVLAGPCKALRQAWGLNPEDEFQWCAAVVNRPAAEVRRVIDTLPLTRLLIVNTADECIVGGSRSEVEVAVERLGCDVFFLEGVVTVHCDAIKPAADAYRALHVFPTSPVKDIRFYSCYRAATYQPTSESAADSILQQALHGFDFTKTVNKAYADGVRTFIDMGPGTSCKRMIDRILGDRPHVTATVGGRQKDGPSTVFRCLATLITERQEVNLDYLYGPSAFPAKPVSIRDRKDLSTEVSIPIGGRLFSPTLPVQPVATADEQNDDRPKTVTGIHDSRKQPAPDRTRSPVSSFGSPYKEMLDELTKNIAATDEVHRKFLDFSEELTRSYGEMFSLQEQLYSHLIEKNGEMGGPADRDDNRLQDQSVRTPSSIKVPVTPAFTREQCLEFATGSVAAVLGPDFAPVDTYRTRVRLPDEPLMFVDRIVSVDGQKKSLSSGRVVTEHDVLPGAWYLDGNQAPVCISVEAGQADLFLCAYLGIDLKVKGERAYRLLDASIVFHRGLPRPGDTIRYEIEIEKFIRQGDTWLFFFSFEGYIGTDHLISMSDGCAGFFTEAEIQRSGGIILSDSEKQPEPGRRDPSWTDLVTLKTESYDADALDALRAGNLSACFGPTFDGIALSESLRLPGGRMKLIDRITTLDPDGGRFGLGMVRAEADIHPDDWFLTCHFVDDMTMPGTLMYECCAHTLRVFLQRIGWVTTAPDVRYEPIPGVKSILKCRGPVTPRTGQVVYEVEIKEIGYGPEPYVIADANMYGDGHYIVRFTDMGMKMSGLSRPALEAFWQESPSVSVARSTPDQKPPLYDRDKILAFAVGSPSKAFGSAFKPFDRDRFIARLPGPPYSFIDRIVSTEPRPLVLEPDGWIEAEYDVPPDAWYFRANRADVMPMCVLMEIVLQPCGWLAAYAGSALKSEQDLKFRNLDGRAVLHRNVLPDAGPLTMRSRLRKASQAGDIIIEEFDFTLFQSGQCLYEGTTSFGFFTDTALAQQKGITGGRDAAQYRMSAEEKGRSSSRILEDYKPLTPDDTSAERTASLNMPAKALRMIDRIDDYLPDGGPHGLGYIRGTKTIDPREWFFDAHFYQDPVCPGSLGIESFIQLLKYAAIQRWQNLDRTHCIHHMVESAHTWKYRGQILPQNQTVTVEAMITAVRNEPLPEIRADGCLSVDGLYIYEMKNFGIKLVPIT